MKSFLNYSKNRILYNIFRGVFVFLTVFLVSKCDVKADELVEFSSKIQNIGYGWVKTTGEISWDGTTTAGGGKSLGPTNYTYIPGKFYSNAAEVYFGTHYLQLIMSGGSISSNKSYKLQIGISTTSTDMIMNPSRISETIYCEIERSSGNYDKTLCTNTTISISEDGNNNYTITFNFTTLADATGLGIAFSTGTSNPLGQTLVTNLFTNYSDEQQGITIREAYLFMVENSGGTDGSVDLGPIINQNQTIINQNNQTNQKLDQAEETRKGMWETIKDLPNMFLDMLKSLFIPSDDFFEEFINTFMETLKEKLGFLIYPFEVFVDVINRFLDIPNGDGIIHIPQINDPFYNQKLIPEQDFNIGEIFKTGKIGELHSIYLTFIDFYIIIKLINLALKKFNSTFGGGVTE